MKKIYLILILGLFLLIFVSASINIKQNGESFFYGSGTELLEIINGINITTGNLHILSGNLHLDGNLIHDLGNVTFSGGDFSVDDSNFFIDINTAYVGIGTNNPSAKLHINGSGSTANSNEAGIRLTNTADGGDEWFLRTGATGTSTPAGGFSIADTTAYRLVIDQTGNVGIGTNNPSKKLDINGGLLVGGNIQVVGTVDGRNIANDGTKLDGISTNAEVSTKEFFLPAGSGILDNNAVFIDEAIVLPDDVAFARAYFNFHLPSDFSSMASGYPKIIILPGTGGGGNVRIAFNSQSGGVGEQLGSSVDSINEYTKTVSSTGNIIIEEDISNAFDSLSLSTGDSVSFYIQRDSDDVGDTYSGGLNIIGVIIKY